MSADTDQEYTRTLREQVVRTGRLLGWGDGDVAIFARALTGRDWEECGEPELEEVLAEYEALLEACYAKRARKGRAAACTSETVPAGRGMERRAR